MYPLEKQYDEKRSFIRMKVNTPVELVTLDTHQSYSGMCQDLSGGGMLLSLDTEIALDTELLVTLSSVHGHNPMLVTRCTVSRIEPGPKNTFLLGLEINEVLNQSEPESKQSNEG